MSLIKKLQTDIEIIEKKFPYYQLISSGHEDGILIYKAENKNESIQEKLTIGIDDDGTRTLCKLSNESNRWKIVGKLN